MAIRIFNYEINFPISLTDNGMYGTVVKLNFVYLFLLILKCLLRYQIKFGNDKNQCI